MSYLLSLFVFIIFSGFYVLCEILLDVNFETSALRLHIFLFVTTRVICRVYGVSKEEAFLWPPCPNTAAASPVAQGQLSKPMTPHDIWRKLVVQRKSG